MKKFLRSTFLAFILLPAVYFSQTCTLPVVGPFYEDPGGLSNNINNAKAAGLCYTVPAAPRPYDMCFSYLHPPSGSSVSITFMQEQQGCPGGSCTYQSTTSTGSLTTCITQSPNCNGSSINTYDDACNLVAANVRVGPTCGTGMTPGNTYIVCIRFTEAGCTGAINVCPILGCGTGNCGCASTTSAGSNQSICAGTSITLAGQNAAPGTGTWTQTSGPGGATITSPNAYNSTVTGLTGGTYVFRWTVNCGSLTGVFDDMQVTVNAAPSVGVTTSNSNGVCVGQSSVTLTGSGANTYTWTPSTGLSGTTGSSVTANPASTTTYTVTGTNTATGCTNRSTIVVNANSAPTVNINASASSICIGQTSTTLTATGGSTYTWSPSSGLSGTTGSSVTASPTATTTYTVIGTSAAGCTDNGTVTVTANSVPTVNASSSGGGSLCIGQTTVTLTATGGSTYTWTPSTGLSGTTGSSVTANPTTTTTYTLTGTSAAGCTDNGTIVVTANSAPTVNINASGSAICIGQTSVTLTATGGSTYTWTPSSGLSGTTGSSVTANPTTNTTYTVTGTSAAGCTNRGTAAITANAAPTVNASSSAGSMCIGQTTVTLTATGGSTYTWTPSSGLSGTTGSSVTANPTTNTTYTVTGTSAAGCTDNGTVTVTANTVPVVNASSSGSGSLCIGQTSVTLTATGGSTYTWTPSSGLSGTTGSSVTANPTATTTYTVTGTSASGCTDNGTVVITANTTPTININASGSAICIGQTSVVLTATGGSTYTWTPSSGLSGTSGSSVTATPTTNTTYTVTGTSAAGCTNQGTAIVNANSPPVVGATSSGGGSLCVGQTSVTLTATGANTYTWTPSSGLSGTTGGSVTANPTATTTYSVTGTNTGTGCTNNSTIVVTANTPPGVTANGSAGEICQGQTSVSLTAGGATTFTWTPGSGLSGTTGSPVTATPTASTTYTVTGTNAATGCTNTALVAVSVNAPPTSSTTTINSNINCFGGTNGSITANPGGGTPSYNYTWLTTGQTGQTATGLTVGTYTVRVTDSKGCTNLQTATITQPTSSLTSTVSATSNVNCFGGSNGSATVTPGGGTPSYNYTWLTTGQTGQTATGLTSGVYTVTVTDANGCTSIQTVSISQPTASLTATVTAGGNVSCFGGNNGTASVTPAGGTPAYTYLWLPGGQTSSSISNLASGPYTITVTDANGCTDRQTVTITQPPGSLSSTVTAVSNVNCFGGSNGIATIGATGGTPGYSYSWNTGQTTTTISNLTSGTYTVSVTDALGCSNIQIVSISQPSAPLTSTVSAISNVSCFGGAGTATVTPTGGTPSYTYSWNTTPVQTTPNGTGLSSGTYTVRVTDAQGCTANQTVTITQPTAALTTTISSQQNVNCFGGIGTATVNPTGGTPNYTYSWSTTPIQTTPNGTGLSSGIYTVSVTDAQGCTADQIVTITQPVAAITTSISSQQNVNCFGGIGTATVSPAGGTPNYTYSWNTTPVQTTPNGTGLSSGTYTVRVTDAQGCTAEQTVSITQPTAALTTTISSQQDVNCFGGVGTATVSPTGGTPNYTYSWNTTPVQTTPNGTGLSSGTYTVRVTDAQGCTADQVVTIIQPTASLTATITATTGVSCFGGNSGTATVTPSGGTPNYTYLWTGGQTGPTATGLSNNSYTVTITDQQGCTTQVVATITQPVGALSIGITGTTPVTCKGAQNGNATVTASQGTPNYTYLWQPGGQTTPVATGLSGGQYTVTVTDSKGCVKTDTVTVRESLNPLIASVTNNKPVSCYGSKDGTASVTPTGGTPPYTYLWNSAPPQTTQTVTGLGGGFYTVTVTDQFGCSVVDTIEIKEAESPITHDVNGIKPVSCKGANDGTAVASTFGGVTPYIYSWTPNVSTTNMATGLAPGIYTVTVTDQFGCSKSDTVEIKESLTQFNVNVSSIVPVTCMGSQNGSITVSATGGTQAYTYQWSPNVSTTNIGTNLAGGTYTITVTDLFGCQRTVIDTVKESTTPFNVNVSSTVPVTCTGSQNGSITVSATGGTQAYTYQWSPNVSTTNIGTNLAGGTYTITVTDMYGCQRTVIDTVKESQTPFNVNVSNTTPVTCMGMQNGSITVTATGGTQNYTYQWNPNVSNTNTATGLSGGIYTITVTDQYGCQRTVIDSVRESKTSLNLSVGNVTPVTCTGYQDGTITVNASGGTQPYTYIWSPNVSTSNVGSNLAGGTYSVTVMDQFGCQQSFLATVPESQVLLNVNVNTTPASCNKDDGTITITPSGGMPGYTYNWNPNITTGNSISGLAAGTWTITVTDQYGCSGTVQATVNQPPGVIGDFNFTPASGTAPLTVNFTNGSTGGIGFQWNFGDTTITIVQDTVLDPIHMFRDSGTYTIRMVVYNQFGCADTVVKTLRINLKSKLCIPNIFSPNGDDKNDIWKLCDIGIEELNVIIYDRWGLLIYQWDTPNGGWDGRTTAGQEVPEGTYYYVIVARGSDGVDYGTTAGFLTLLRK